LPPKEEGIINVYYFIGRLNPPHQGHITALMELIKRAILDNLDNPNYKIIILLGSGPKKLRSLDNPLPFLTKKEFITYKLKTEIASDPNLMRFLDNFDFDRNVEILEMNSASQQITEITSEFLSVSDLIQEINMYRFSGAKDGDDKKLNFIEESIMKILNEYKSILSTEVISVNPVINEDEREAMSATEVRLSILKGFLENDIDRYFDIYTDFYGSIYTPKIAREIADVTQIEGSKKVQDYITKKGTKKGGSKRKRLTKRKRKSKRSKALGEPFGKLTKRNKRSKHTKKYKRR